VFQIIQNQVHLNGLLKIGKGIIDEGRQVLINIDDGNAEPGAAEPIDPRYFAFPGPVLLENHNFLHGRYSL